MLIIIIGFFACFHVIYISRTQSYQQNRHILFLALVALKLLASFISLLVACSARIVGDRQTDRQTHRTTTVTLAAHARRGLMTIAIQPLDSGPEMVAVSNIGSIDDAEAMQGGGNDKPLWSTVIRRRRANHQGQGQGIREGATTGNTAPRNSRHRRSTQWLTITNASIQPKQPKTKSIRATSTGPSTATNKSPACEEVSGVRRIWGTMRSCTSRAVLTTLQRMSKLSEKFQVRRKFKKRDNGALQWWFLIRGDEPDLLVLDQEWEAVQMQTSWKLERCHKPVTQESGEKDTSFLGHD